MIILAVIAGCQSQDRVKGVKEKGKFESEPEIKVELSSGSTKEMKLEEYVTGVVAGEMKKDWPVNAYAVQAILARSFALKYLEENKTDTISSSYKFAQEYKPSNINEQIKNGVSKTRGEVVLYDDKYVKGWFHSSAGGKTTTAKVGLAYEKEEPPYIKSVKSPDQEAPAEIKNWSAKFNSKEILNALEKMGKNIGELKNIKIDKKDKTGRAINFVFSGDNGSVTIKAANFRKDLDPKKLKSTKIETLEKEGNSYIFEGSGFGHGVGLSQWGVYAMAKEGKSPEEIVKHYFQDIEISKVYE